MHTVIRNIPPIFLSVLQKIAENAVITKLLFTSVALCGINELTIVLNQEGTFWP